MKVDTQNDIPFSLLVACCQSTPDKETIAKIHTLLYALSIENKQWQALVRHAHMLAVFPLFYKALNLYGKESVPEARITQPHDFYLHHIARGGMTKSAELIAIDKLASKAGIEMLVLKGPAVAQIGYGDITMRHYSDLDLYIHKEDYLGMSEILRSRGFIPTMDLQQHQRIFFEMNKDCSFHHDSRGLTIEVHWEFFEQGSLRNLFKDAWEDTILFEINGHRLQTLSHESHLLFLALHGSKHYWERLGWIVDIDRMVRSVPPLDWERMLRKAEGKGVLKMFLLGIALSKRYFDTPLPSSVEATLSAVDLSEYMAYVEAEFKSSDPLPFQLRERTRMHDTWYHQSRDFLDRLFRPTVAETDIIKLPDALFWLYVPLRTVRLIFILPLRGVKRVFEGV